MCQQGEPYWTRVHFFYVKIQTSNALAINFILACYNKSVRSYHLKSKVAQAMKNMKEVHEFNLVFTQF